MYTLLGVRVCAFGVYMLGSVYVCALSGTHFWECVFVRLGVHIVGTVRVCALDENVRLS